MEINGKTRLLGLLGDPVQHTLSPLIHNTLSDILGINEVYVPFHTHKEGLADAVKGAFELNILGMNATVPHKNEIKAYGVKLDGKRVIILGAGGAARAVAYMCMNKGADKVYILNRMIEKAQTIAEDMNGHFGRETMTAM